MIAVSNVLLVIVPSGFPHKFCGGADCKDARDIAINVVGDVRPNGMKNPGNVPLLSSVVQSRKAYHRGNIHIIMD